MCCTRINWVEALGLRSQSLLMWWQILDCDGPQLSAVNLWLPPPTEPCVSVKNKNKIKKTYIFKMLWIGKWIFVPTFRININTVIYGGKRAEGCHHVLAKERLVGREVGVTC